MNIATSTQSQVFLFSCRCCSFRQTDTLRLELSVKVKKWTAPHRSPDDLQRWDFNLIYGNWIIHWRDRDQDLFATRLSLLQFLCSALQTPVPSDLYSTLNKYSKVVFASSLNKAWINSLQYFILGGENPKPYISREFWDFPLNLFCSYLLT